jgi:hypothetical protein
MNRKPARPWPQEPELTSGQRTKPTFRVRPCGWECCTRAESLHPTLPRRAVDADHQALSTPCVTFDEKCDADQAAAACANTDRLVDGNKRSPTPPPFRASSVQCTPCADNRDQPRSTETAEVDTLVAESPLQASVQARLKPTEDARMDTPANQRDDRGRFSRGNQGGA